jgi:hypothetical protein
MRYRNIILFSALLAFLPHVSANQINGFARLAWTYSDTDENWLRSWLRDGTGVTRYDHLNDGLDISQVALEASIDLGSVTQLHVAASYYPDGETELGINEVFIHYKPLSPGWQQQWRVGAFYPNMSLENPSTAWNSPYTYSFSAINSWVAEELRVIGAEWALRRPGRRFKSPHSFTLLASAYTANDPLGTMLSWRGWAVHDRQTRLGERIEFAHYPSLDTVLPMQPSWVEPIEEIDDTLGFYLGGHWQYQNQSDLRVYYYHNQADETARSGDYGQYAWRTRFWSVAWQYRFDKQHRFLTQWMNGNTIMGKKPVVDVDFSAWYALYSYKIEQHRFSVRYDDFETTDEDHYPVQDPNASKGDSWTLAWRYDFNDSYQIGIEYLNINSWNDNRWLWQWPREERQQQLQLVVDYRF